MKAKHVYRKVGNSKECRVRGVQTYWPRNRGIRRDVCKGEMCVWHNLVREKPPGNGRMESTGRLGCIGVKGEHTNRKGKQEK